MITVRPSSARGRTQLDWLDSRHTFSFGGYFDPRYVGFRSLRVLNDDRVKPGGGFGAHPHQDMEILSLVLDGALEHKDSLGHGSVIKRDDLQRMTAGTGVTHSEFNPSPTEPVHFLQIWIIPERPGLAPGYEQKTFPESERRNALRLVASRDGSGGALTVHRDVAVHLGHLDAGGALALAVPPGRHAWVHVFRGHISVNGTMLVAGDGAAASDEGALEVKSPDTEGDAAFLILDLA
jgi:hypothetical protein